MILYDNYFGRRNWWVLIFDESGNNGYSILYFSFGFVDLAVYVIWNILSLYACSWIDWRQTWLIVIFVFPLFSFFFLYNPWRIAHLLPFLSSPNNKFYVTLHTDILHPYLCAFLKLTHSDLYISSSNHFEKYKK